VAIIGSIYTMLIVLALALPIGVCASIYLEEFAPKNRWTDLIEVNINNLAAVPSIVYGLLGLSIFINLLGMPRSASIVGGIVLALMTLPTIIIATRAALKAVPPSIRAAALGLGASKMQTVVHHVLPLAMPGILTGTIIGLANALGETAPTAADRHGGLRGRLSRHAVRASDGAAGADLYVGERSGTCIRRTHLGRDHHPARVPDHHEPWRHHAAPALRTPLVGR
jgi:ABC-type proline/glycine betaine transport system permease subunit